jgi:4-hydroxybenzoate polyprenyltransferase
MSQSFSIPPASPATAPVNPVAAFLDLIKFAHSVFALPFALIATFWAFRTLGISIISRAALGRLGLILACMVFARTWAMTFNRLIDRRFDAANPRTARRPSVTGAVSVGFMQFTLAVCLGLFLLATAGFLFFGNPWPLMLALPVLAWLATYSLTKRFTALCHYWLGISLGLAPLSAWLAIAPPNASPLDPRAITALLLGGGVACWVAGFDILYALQDESVDRDMHLHSIPAAFGRRRALLASRLSHAATAIFFLAVGLTGHFHLLYYLGYVAAVLLLVIEQSLVSEKDISRINLAFMTANGAIGLTFGALAIADTLIFH